MENIQSEASLYGRFKTLEIAIKERFDNFNAKKGNYKQLCDIKEFQEIFEVAMSIMKDLSFSFKKKLDKRIWELCRLSIQEFNKLKIQEDYVIALNTFYESKVVLIQKLLKKLLADNKQFEEILGNKAEKIIIANVCTYYGEMLQSREKLKLKHNLKPDLKSMQITSNLYYKAINIYPFSGKFYYLFSELANFNNDTFCSVYWCIRAASCIDDSHESHNILKQLFHKTQNELIQNPKNSKECWETLKAYCVLYFKQVYEQEKHIKIQQLLVNLRKVLPEIENKKNQLQVVSLSFMIHICLYAVFITVESNTLKRSYYQLKQDYQYKLTIKNTFTIILTILELFNNVNDKKGLLLYSNLIIPVIVYLHEFPNTQKLVEEEFKEFENLFLCIYKKCEKFKERTRIQYKLFDCETNLIGWKMFTGYYQNEKNNRVMEMEKDELVKITWIAEAIKSLDYVNVNNVKDSYHEIKIKVIDHDSKRNKEESKDKTLIVVDGRNVAIRHGNQQFFSSRGLEIIVKYWRTKFYPIIIILPQYCFDEQEIERRRGMNKKNDKTIPDNIEILKKLRKDGFAVGVPNRDYEDSYIIEYAKNKKAYIVSNDYFNDHKTNQKLNAKERESLKEYLNANCMSFAYIQDDFIPNPDFMKRKNII